MSSQHKVQVELGPRSYDIHIGSGLLKEIQSYIPISLEDKSIFILTDDNIDALRFLFP
jgi:3-dehydroquinate synthetase